MPISFRTYLRKNIDLDAIAKEIQQPTKLLREIQAYRKEKFQGQIRTNRDASGKPLARLSPAYAREKYRAVGRKPIRVRSGDMVNSYRSRVYRDRVIETVEDYKAIFFQEGTDNMVQRKLLPESFEDMPISHQKHITRMTNRWLRDLFKKSKSIRSILGI